MKRLAYKFLLLMPFSVILLLSGCKGFSVLNPKGPSAQASKDLIVWSIILMLTIVLTVFVIFTIFLVRYRERANNAYDPEQEGHYKLEIVWTIIPVIIVVLLAVPTIKTIYSVDSPPEASAGKEPLVIHVTTADWKFIFSYPDQDIETVNYVNIPKDVPVHFKLASADSMASMWIPELGGEKYAMAGMQTEQTLQADETGTFNGRNGNFTGKGFAKMRFKVHAQTEDDFQEWAKDTKEDAPELSEGHYQDLLEPGIVGTKAFSNTHLDYVDHAKNASYKVDHDKNQY